MTQCSDTPAMATDYRDELGDLIRSRFQSQKEFCQATGLAEDVLDRVLEKREHFDIVAFSDALLRIGYRIDIVRAN